MNEEIKDDVFKPQLEPLVESYMDYIIKKRLAAFTPEQKRADGWPVSEEGVKALYNHAYYGTRVDLPERKLPLKRGCRP